MSDTPITDNAILTEPYQVRELVFEVVKADHMAELERELNEANAERAQVWDLLHEAYQPLRQSGSFELSERIRFLVDHGPKAYRNKYQEATNEMP